MIYLWVAIGGALGSVARFWLNNAVASVAGAEFPWGTLLINVIGSFVISFFGTLTTKAARFAVPPEITIFVMVGICGGFTTFSSFSLQTVQLARAGEWERVGWYVSASVILCVLVCWLGIISGLALSGSSMGTRTAATPDAASIAKAATGSDSRSAAGAVLTLLPNAQSTVTLLESARVLADILGTNLAALHVRVDPESTVIPSAEVLTLAQAEEISAPQAELQAAVEQAVAVWRHAHPDAVLNFLQPFGDKVLEFQRAGHDATAIVAPVPQRKIFTGTAVSTAIFDIRCPVLVLPENTAFTPGGHIAIGWKDIGHARGAITAAMPLLAQASRITIIGIGDPSRLNFDRAKALLGTHADRASLINLPRGSQSVGNQLVTEAGDRKAGLLVLGAHRHGRMAEWVFGGVTASALVATHIPLFLKH